MGAAYIGVESPQPEKKSDYQLRAERLRERFEAADIQGSRFWAVRRETDQGQEVLFVETMRPVYEEAVPGIVDSIVQGELADRTKIHLEQSSHPSHRIKTFRVRVAVPKPNAGR